MAASSHSVQFIYDDGRSDTQPPSAGARRLRQQADTRGSSLCQCCPLALLQPQPLPTATRLILPFRRADYCCAGEGLVGGAEAALLPPALASLGVDGAAWERAVMALRTGVQPRGCGCMWTTAAVVPYCWPLLAPCACWRSVHYHRALRAWLADLNRDVLGPRGAHAAFQAAMDAMHCCALPGIAAEWLAVALNAREARALDAEPALWVSAEKKTVLVPHVCAMNCCCCSV